MKKEIPSKPKKQKTQEEADQQVSALFPQIEKLIDSEDFSAINRDFMVAYEELEKLSKARGGLGKSRDARKAMKSIERVMDLIRDLLKLKYQINEKPSESAENALPRKK